MGQTDQVTKITDRDHRRRDACPDSDRCRVPTDVVTRFQHRQTIER
jgi:hypothetical protein